MRHGVVGRAAVDDENSYRSFRCERTEATVAAIFAPLLKVGVMTDISGGFMTIRGRGGDSIWGEAGGSRTTGSEADASPMILSGDVAESIWVRGNPVITHLSVNRPLFL